MSSQALTRRRFLTLTGTACGAAFVGGCGPVDTRVNPPIFEREVSAIQLMEEARLHARDLPGGPGMHYLVLPTGSMEPTLKGGDYIVVDNMSRPYASLKQGEIITYYADWQPAGSPPVTHRLAQKDSYGWILSGDNNRHYESRWRVTEKNYIGVVVAIYRRKVVKS